MCVRVCVLVHLLLVKPISVRHVKYMSLDESGRIHWDSCVSKVATGVLCRSEVIPKSVRNCSWCWDAARVMGREEGVEMTVCV